MAVLQAASCDAPGMAFDRRLRARGGRLGVSDTYGAGLSIRERLRAFLSAIQSLELRQAVQELT